MRDMCREHRCLTTCQKQYRQNEPAGQIDVPTWIGLCDGVSQTLVGITDVSPPVKNNTDRMNQLVKLDIPYQGGGPCNRGFWTCVEPQMSHRLSKTTQTE